MDQNPIATVNGEKRYSLIYLYAKKATPITGTIPTATCQTLSPLSACQPSFVKNLAKRSL